MNVEKYTLVHGQSILDVEFIKDPRISFCKLNKNVNESTIQFRFIYHPYNKPIWYKQYLSEVFVIGKLRMNICPSNINRKCKK